MSSLQTTVEFQPDYDLINYTDGLVLLGSCFTEYIGARMLDAGLDALMNPAGITYNPASISITLSYLSGENQLELDQFQSRRDVFFHWDFHSRYSSLDKESALNQMKSSVEQGRQQLTEARHVVLSLGTAWVYKLRSTNVLVNNCHKMPGNLFDRQLLSLDEILEHLQSALATIHSMSPKAQIIFTLSPVRHWKDGAEQNSVSKSLLRVAIDKMCSHDKVHYFPSYEVMMDELRDYRFYDTDLLHPSSLAQEIIWQRFLPSFDAKTQEYISNVDSLNRMNAHRVQFPGSEEALKLEKAKERLEADIRSEFPNSPFNS